MRLLVTADLHYNHLRSKRPADDLIDQINRLGEQQHIDALLFAGDTAVADGDAIERCLSRIRFAGEKIFLAGNHELWTRSDDSYAIFRDALPRRIRAIGWRWLEDDSFVSSDRRVAIAGTVGWYDYSFAVPQLAISRESYATKVIANTSGQTTARWNDGKFVKLHRSDQAFLDELLTNLGARLDSLRDVPRVLVAVHHVPFEQLLPPHHGTQWDFVRAYLGSRRIGELLTRYAHVRDVVCGHSHVPVETMVGQQVRAINIGSGYRSKVYRLLELD
jgi:3',5'-cyclic AMP phosphodiesterase CpdA